MKKLISLILCIFTLLAAVSCGNAPDTSAPVQESMTGESSHAPAESSAQPEESSIADVPDRWSSQEEPVDIDKESLNLMFAESAEDGGEGILTLVCGISRGKAYTPAQIGVSDASYKKSELTGSDAGGYDAEIDIIAPGDKLFVYSSGAVKKVKCERAFIRFAADGRPYLCIKVDSALPEGEHVAACTRTTELSTFAAGAKFAFADVNNDRVKDTVSLTLEGANASSGNGDFTRCVFDLGGIFTAEMTFNLTSGGDVSFFAAGDIDGDGAEEIFVRADGRGGTGPVFEILSPAELRAQITLRYDSALHKLNRIDAEYITAVGDYAYFIDKDEYALCRKKLPWDNEAESERIGSATCVFRDHIIGFGGCVYYNAATKETGDIMKYDIAAGREYAVAAGMLCFDFDISDTGTLYFTTSDCGVYALELSDPEAKPQKLFETVRIANLQYSNGKLWLGDEEKLLEYDLAAGEQRAYPAAMMGFAVDGERVYYLDLDTVNICGAIIDPETETLREITPLADEKAVAAAVCGDYRFVTLLSNEGTKLLDKNGKTVYVYNGRSPVVTRHGVFMIENGKSRIVKIDVPVE